MPLSNPALWERLEKFDIDDQGSAFSFSQRLARENNWSRSFTLKVIKEYKKFAYLSVISETAVTPSDEIDQAWHLHLLYTENYWDVFCDKVLQHKFHHGPTKGGKKEISRFEDQYQRTQDLYNQEFDLSAPEDIWPKGDIRFSRPLKDRKVNLQDYWIFPKPGFMAGKLQHTWLLLPLLILTACSEGSVDAFFEISSGKVFFALIYTFAAIGYKLLSKDSSLLYFLGFGIASWIGHSTWAEAPDVGPWMLWLGAWILSVLVAKMAKIKGGGCSGCSGCGGCG